MIGPHDRDTHPASVADADALQRYASQIAHERDEAHRKLQEREAELARVQRIGRVGGVEVDLRDGFRNRRSPEYLAIHGLPSDATHESHEDWVARIHPDDRERTVQAFLNALKSATDDYTIEYRIIRPSDGIIRWIAVTARIERDADGRALRLIGAHIDITDRMLAQETLRESEERFRLIANSAPVPIWVTKLDRTRAFVNQAYLDFVGLHYDDALTFDWRTVLHPDDLPRIAQEQIAGEGSLKPFVLEARYRNAHGDWRWLRSESQPRRDPLGNHIGFIGVAHDITVAKTAEIELRRMNETLEQRILERTAQLEAGEAQMRTIFETSNQYQGLLDLNGRIIYTNRTSLADIHAEAADVVGHHLWETPWFTGTPGKSEYVCNSFQRVLNGDDARAEMQLDLPVGLRSFEFTMRPVFDPRGAIVGVLAEAIDITERLQAEDALRQSQKMEAVGQLTGGVAHDFNNLLTIIRSATDFLRRRDLPDDKRRRYVDAISDTVDRAAKLTSQLLAFARRQPLKPEVFDVGKQVESVVQLIRPLVGSRIQIDVAISLQPCFALADTAQFETAIINLAVNGRDAMAGEGRLAIAVAEVSAIPALRGQTARTGNFIAVTITDTGMGISADQHDAVFEPFFTTKEVGKGTGLGLSQAIGFAKQSGGDIELLSEAGKGATFTIYLPQATMPRDGAALADTTTDSEAIGGSQRILVVEDNEDVGRFSTAMLEDLGYAIRWVPNAADALAVLAKDEFAFDLVFSDVIMPGMNGVDLAIMIREKFPGLPVVLTSGYSDVLAENADRGFELIQKPYSVEALSRTLRKVIADKR